MRDKIRRMLGNRKVVVCFALALSLALGLSAGALAYLTDSGSIQNRLHPGGNSIEVKETFTPPPELTEGENTFTKDVQVTNTGAVPCYVRVFCDFSDSTIAQKAKLSTEEKDSPSDWKTLEEYRSSPPEGWAWVSSADDPLLGGYFYCTEPLQPGETTPYLLRSVQVTFGAPAEIRDFEIIVSAESVQTRDHLGQEASGPDAWKTIWNDFLSRR